MSERERWIVYPLLFFALGAALRDKFTQQVQTDRLHAGQISCEQLLITDSEKPDRVVAKLSSNPPSPGAPVGDRFGVLVLYDSEGKEFCGVTNQVLQVKHIQAQQVSVVDPQNAQQPLALMTSATATAPDKSTRRIGSLLLADDKGQPYFVLVNDQLKMRQVICEGVAVVDPENHDKVLAGLGSLAMRPKQPGGKPERFGVLALNNQEFGMLTGNPPPSARKLPSPEKKSEEAGANPPEASPQSDAIEDVETPAE